MSQVHFQQHIFTNDGDMSLEKTTMNQLIVWGRPGFTPD
jgi:hypothetical protein